MKKGELDAKKKTGLILLVVVVFCWVVVPVLPFVEFPHKAIVITALLISGEILFVFTIALLGKEYWDKIKKRFSQTFSYKKKDKSSVQSEAAIETGSSKDESESK